MPTHTHIGIFVVIALLSGAVAEWLVAKTGVSLFTPYSVAVMATFGILTVFNHWIWRWPSVNDWMGSPPDLRGTWRATFHCERTGDDSGGAQISPVMVNTIYLRIEQTYFSISINMFSERSDYEIVSTKIDRLDQSKHRVAFIYRSTLKKEQMNNERQSHRGTVLLTVYGSNPKEIEACHWTDRGTKGSATLKCRKSKLVTNVIEAATLFGDLGSEKRKA